MEEETVTDSVAVGLWVEGLEYESDSDDSVAPFDTSFPPRRNSTVERNLSDDYDSIDEDPIPPPAKSSIVVQVPARTKAKQTPNKAKRSRDMESSASEAEHTPTRDRAKAKVRKFKSILISDDEVESSSTKRQRTSSTTTKRRKQASGPPERKRRRLLRRSVHSIPPSRTTYQAVHHRFPTHQRTRNTQVSAADVTVGSLLRSLPPRSVENISISKATEKKKDDVAFTRLWRAE
ncbi:hypothetical protein MMC07_007761 [Pseudocyphellaria aurata]|nr:hypothetical protein [Pseudocyphellaria aurata]